MRSFSFVLDEPEMQNNIMKQLCPVSLFYNLMISKFTYSVEVQKHLLCVLCASDLLMRIIG